VNADLAAPANSSSSQLKTRLITGVILLCGFGAALLWLPPMAWRAFVTAVIALAAWEWAGFSTRHRRPRVVYTLVTVALGLAVPVLEAMPIYAASALFWVLVVPVWLRKHWKPAQPLSWISGWIVLLPAGLALVSLRADSPLVLLAALAVVWVADSAAYFAGRAYGRRKLAPSVSPGKTWEGVAGAVVAVSLYGIGLAAFAPSGCDTPCLLRLLPALWAVLALSILGDLFESLQKRQAGIKDSGSVLPGHGGILDRIDAQLAALPAAALLFSLWGP
jgi:phosphatidate cytidylyltransferase